MVFRYVAQATNQPEIRRIYTFVYRRYTQRGEIDVLAVDGLQSWGLREVVFMYRDGFCDVETLIVNDNNPNHL